jgi:Na+-transporting NADH:ubiquinone oxidoreductase subunit A
VHEFRGPHPSGLPGTHIARIQPLKAGEVAFTLRATDVARIGEWQLTGRYPHQQVVAVAGSAAPQRQYFRVRQGAQIQVLTGGKPLTGDVRVINGTVLHGTQTAPDGFLAFRAATLTVIPEGTNQRDLLGWFRPQLGKPVFHRRLITWLQRRSAFRLDARLHGGHRPIVNIGSWARVMALDIHPVHLVRAIQAGDLEEAVKLGLLEVVEEDVALCTFVDPCKIDVGAIVRAGLDKLEKEG